jgi:predicted Zn-ribbon and HTH transcriptional regulator
MNPSSVPSDMPKEPKTEIRGVQKCEACGYYIGRKIIRSRGVCANCNAKMIEEKK